MELAMWFNAGGPFLYAVVGLALVGWVPSVGAAVLTAFGYRVPAALWILGAVGVLLLGAAGTYLGLTEVTAAVASASAEMRATLGAAGLSLALIPALAARLFAALLLLFAGVLAAISHPVGAGPLARWTIPHAVLPVLIGGAVGLGVGVGALTLHVGLPGLGIALVTLLGAGALGVVSLRGVDVWDVADEADGVRARGVARRLAAGRGMVALCFVAAAWMASTATEHWMTYQAFEAVAMVDPESRALLIEAGLEHARDARWLGLFAAGGLALAGLAATSPVLEHLGHWRTGLGLALLAVLLLPLVGLALATGSALEGLHSLVNLPL